METKYDFSLGKRGAIEPTPAGKTRITIRLDDEILAWFCEQVNAADGGNYQTLINDALHEYIQQRCHTWTEQDQLDLASFSLQYAASIFPDSEEAE
jgi:BrnA antitoxin of type II toxin-antitoxin system